MLRGASCICMVSTVLQLWACGQYGAAAAGVFFAVVLAVVQLSILLCSFLSSPYPVVLPQRLPSRSLRSKAL